MERLRGIDPPIIDRYSGGQSKKRGFWRVWGRFVLYDPRSELKTGGGRSVNRALDEFIDVLVAVVLLILSIPFLVLAAVMVKIADRGEILWSGERLGRHRLPFSMYKIRTLTDGAETLIGDKPITRSMAENSRLQHRFGEFLRNSRLDELPQLFNVIRGDMRLVGPRPIRREVYEAECQVIPDYERRFAVKPGLVGYSQVLTPHSCDKRIRKKIDNRFVSETPSFLRRFLFLFCVLLVLVLRLPIEFARNLRRVGGVENRRLRRVAQNHCRVQIVDGDGQEGVAKNLNDDSMLIFLDSDDIRPGTVVRLVTRMFDWGRLRTKKKSSLCRLLTVERRQAGTGNCPSMYLVSYEPVSPLNHYILHKYVLRRSLL